MQGQRNSISTLPEDLTYDHGSTSTDASIDSRMPWNNMQTSAEARLPEYKIPPSETDTQHPRHIGHSQWSLGETSSGAAQCHSDRNKRKREHRWSVPSRAALDLEECQLESSNIPPLDNVVVDGQGNQASNISSPLQLAGPVDDGHQVIERPNRHISVGSSSEKRPSTGSSSDALGMSSGYRSLDGRRKRKAIDVQAGQSSGAESSNCSEHAERSQRRAIMSAPPPISASTVVMSTPPANSPVLSNLSDHGNSRIRLGVGEVVSSNPLSSNGRETAGSSRRNLRLRFSNTHQQGHVPLPREAHASSSSWHSSRVLLRNRLNPNPPLENGSHHVQPILPHIHSVRRNHHSRWSGASSSRTSNSSSAAISLERERDPMLYEDPIFGNILRSSSEHPMFIPPSETGGSSQQPPNWNLSSGASASRAGTEPGGGQSSTATGTSQETELPSGSSSRGPRSSNTRSALLERHLDSAYALPHSLWSMAAASEGRGSVMSEQIRHVLDLMRRGEGLRLEDMMILDQSVFFGMGDVHDRHRDMRLDVDNMSYEELLALGERIGDVSMGLNEETIMARLKQRKYGDRRADQAVTEPCSICREEYNNEEDLGTLECGHEFHRDCVKQWLMHKNLCPICKRAALST
ncbi:E3 ubiquitin-protein ligase MBR2-like isoform X3 [Salvia splendens]|uniref:E3 ubiquitin-protein ligase MBR2-like isoform X3 n=1 Tax=Salvia splendens TaxID=180675 RepID=UPI001C25E7FD|nr:E3 ubiquitin-protein ligase MBR2-like isoform X3 [Salvia splendens]